MERVTRRGAGLMLALAGLGLTLVACRDYDVAVTVAADGSGSRTVVLSSDVSSPDDPQLQHLVELFHLSPARGWKRVDPPSGEGAAEQTGAAAALSAMGEQRNVAFERSAKAKDVRGWDGCNGDIHIQGAATDGPRTEIAGAPAGHDVEFRNFVTVEVGTQADRRVVTYRERFAWTGLMEWLALHLGESFGRGLKEAYPFLTDPDLAEIRGYVAGQLTAAIVGRGRDADFDSVLDPLLGPLEDYTRRLILRRRSGADVSGLRDRCLGLLDGEGDELETSLATQLPGADLAVLTGIDLRVTLPGPVTDSNADEIDGNSAVWHIDPWHALGRPFEAFARAEVGGR